MRWCILVRGPLGVGKSTVSEALARALGGQHISIDRILDERRLERWDEDRIALESFLNANRFAVQEAQLTMDAGHPVIFDGNFYWKEQITDLTQRLPGPTCVFTLSAPLDVCIARDRLRPQPEKGREAKGGDQLGEDAAAAVFRLVGEVRYGIEVDATGPVEGIVAQILRHLGSQAAGPSS